MALGFGLPFGARRRTALLAGGVLLVSLGLAACGSSNNNSANNKPATAASASATTAATARFTPAVSAAGQSTSAAAANVSKTGTVKLGLLVSQSGPAAASVSPAIDAVQLAVKQINADGFVVGDTKYTFGLQIADDKSDPNSAVAAATQLSDDKGIKFILGPVTSTLAPPVAQLLAPKKVVMLSPASALDALLSPDQIKGASKTLFKTNFSGASFPKLYAEGLKASFPDAKTVALVFPDDQTGAATSKYFADGLAGSSIKVVANETFPAASSDYSTVLTKVKAANPDVIIVGYLSQHVTGVVKQATDLGIKSGFFTTSGYMSVALKDAIGKPLDVPFGSVYQPIVIEQLPDGQILTNNPAAAKYASDIQNVLGKKIVPGAQTGFYFYDWVFLLRDALVKAGTVSDTTKVSDALETVQRDGAIGTVKFIDHAAAGDADVCTATAGKVTCTTVPNPNK